MDYSTESDINAMHLTKIQPKWTKEELSKIQREDPMGKRIIEHFLAEDYDRRRDDPKFSMWKMYEGILLHRIKNREHSIKFEYPRHIGESLFDQLINISAISDVTKLKLFFDQMLLERHGATNSQAD